MPEKYTIEQIIEIVHVFIDAQLKQGIPVTEIQRALVEKGMNADNAQGMIDARKQIAPNPVHSAQKQSELRIVLLYTFEQIQGGEDPETVQKFLLEEGIAPDLVMSGMRQAMGIFHDPFTLDLMSALVLINRPSSTLLKAKKWDDLGHASQYSRIKQAEEKLRQAVVHYRRHPRVAEMWDMLATCLYNQIRLEETLAVYKTMLSLFPDFPGTQSKILQLLERNPSLCHEETDRTTGGRVVYTRLPETIESIQNLDKAISEYVLNHIDVDAISLSKKSKVFVIGSCIASNMTSILKEEGINATLRTVDEVANSTFVNRMIAESAFGGAEARQTFIPKIDIESFATALSSADLLIYALGVAPCFFNKNTGAFVPSDGVVSVRGVAKGEYIFRNTTVEENVTNLLANIDIIRSVNPNCQFVFLLSPVPMGATLERRSAVEADCLSKSILRVAIDQVVSSRPRCLYWPAFEIIRWLGVYVPNMYGREDGTLLHVSEHVIKVYMQHFLRLFYSKQNEADSGALVKQ